MDGNGLAGRYVDGVEHLAVALFKPVGALLQAAAQRLAEHVLPAVACQRGGDGAILHGGGGLVVRQRLRGGGRSGQQEGAEQAEYHQVDGIGLYQTGGLEGADLFGTHGEVFSSRYCPTNVAVSRGWERAGVR